MSDSKVETAAPEVLFRINSLKKYFPVYGGALHKKIGDVKAVDDVSFTINKGEIVGLVGESGSGKSTVGRMLTKLIQPTSGVIEFQGQDIGSFDAGQVHEFRKHVQIVFQDPFSSLNPRMTVAQIISDPLKVNKICSKQEMMPRVQSLLELVGLDTKLTGKYPHEFGGGDRQRVGIATALAVNPEFVFCDEPVSALDLSAQAKILNLLREIRTKLKLTILVVAHNLSVVEYVSDRVAVMYLGKIVEMAPTDKLYDTRLHPYTQALMSAIPVIDPELARQREEVILKGEIPSPLNPPVGCNFNTRCQSLLGDICYEKDPELVEYKPEHFVACHRCPKK